jgi:nicotinate phosphoribosyltransferase
MIHRIRPLTSVYRDRLPLMNDLYQLAMAASYYDQGMHEQEAVFNLHFRKLPFGGGFAIASGQSHAIDFMLNHFGFDDSDLTCLDQLRGNDDRPLFKEKFLHYLGDLRFSCTVHMVREGTAVFPYEPMVRVRGPIIQGQLLETPLLTLNNFATLVATKATRVGLSTGVAPFFDFGLRRAQGFDGALIASWAAYVGGAAGTSNVYAFKKFGIPCKGTHAHSWVMSFGKELDAFMAWGQSMSNNCTFLVDTYNTIEGVRNAIKVGQWLREHGIEKWGIRLDSGNLAQLSKIARQMLDDAGFPNAVVFASNDLDEYKIARINFDGGKIGAYGVGTMLITCADQPYLGGVYKLSAIRQPGHDWQYKVKLSEDEIKTSIPGIQQVNRYFHRDGHFLGDVIFDELKSDPINNDFVDMKTGKVVNLHKFAGAGCMWLLEQVFHEGRLVNDSQSFDEIRALRASQVESLPASLKRLKRPGRYPVYLESNLHGIRRSLVESARREAA